MTENTNEKKKPTFILVPALAAFKDEKEQFNHKPISIRNLYGDNVHVLLVKASTPEEIPNSLTEDVNSLHGMLGTMYNEPDKMGFYNIKKKRVQEIVNNMGDFEPLDSPELQKIVKQVQRDHGVTLKLKPRDVPRVEMK